MAGPNISPDDHIAYMRLALSYAEKSPPKPTNFRVGAVLVEPVANKIIATGYTLELPGNTHAEQCCLQKLAAEHAVAEADVGQVMPPSGISLYTTMEPCGKRLSGNAPCADRILLTRKDGRNGINTVYLGVTEPQKFVSQNTARARLETDGIKCIHVSGLEEEILRVATAGHNGKEA